jgi:hypothetical protein
MTTLKPDFEEYITLLKIHKPFIKEICNDILKDKTISKENKTYIVKALDILKIPTCFAEV